MNLSRSVWKFARNAGLGKFGKRIGTQWPWPVCVTVDGDKKMYVDLRSTIGQGLFATGTFDVAAIKPALDALSSGATFIDVGANVGYYSIQASALVGEYGQVLSFEIDPRPLRCLRKSILKIGYQNIKVIEAAVADKDGHMTFIPMEEHGHNRIDRESSVGRKVKSVRLDTWVTEHDISRVDVIKIDVEGGEKYVLDGAEELIRRFRPLILCEADDITTANFNYTPHDLIKQLERMGYVTTWVEGVHTPTLLAEFAGSFDQNR